MYPLIKLGGLQIPTYFVIITFSLIGALYYINAIIKNKSHKIKNEIYQLILLLMISAFIGGRALHVLYEEPQYYFNAPLQIFSFWNGGFVYYGGWLLALTVAFIYLYKINRLSSWGFFADLLAPPVAFLTAWGRIACFFQGCCFGHSCELPWAINGLHPTQLYLALSEFLILLLGLYLYLKKYTHMSSYLKKVELKNKNSFFYFKEGQLFLLLTFLSSFARFWIEFLRNDFRGLPLFGLLSLSQGIALLIMLGTLYCWRVCKVEKTL